METSTFVPCGINCRVTQAEKARWNLLWTAPNDCQKTAHPGLAWLKSGSVKFRTCSRGSPVPPRFILARSYHWCRLLTTNSRQQKIPSTSCSKYAINSNQLSRAQQAEGSWTGIHYDTIWTPSLRMEVRACEARHDVTLQGDNPISKSMQFLVAWNCSKSHGGSSITSASSEAIPAYCICVTGIRKCRT